MFGMQLGKGYPRFGASGFSCPHAKD